MVFLHISGCQKEIACVQTPGQMTTVRRKNYPLASFLELIFPNEVRAWDVDTWKAREREARRLIHWRPRIDTGRNTKTNSWIYLSSLLRQTDSFAWWPLLSRERAMVSQSLSKPLRLYQQQYSPNKLYIRRYTAARGVITVSGETIIFFIPQWKCLLKNVVLSPDNSECCTLVWIE